MSDAHLTSADRRLLLGERLPEREDPTHHRSHPKHSVEKTGLAKPASKLQRTWDLGFSLTIDISKADTVHRGQAKVSLISVRNQEGSSRVSANHHEPGQSNGQQLLTQTHAYCSLWAVEGNFKRNFDYEQFSPPRLL